MKKCKESLIQLLNIAGTGSIFGVLTGAVSGSVVFLRIVFGEIPGGAVHDYMSGMISMRHGGEPMPYRHLFDITEGIFRRDMYVEELNTNGYFINQAVLDRMRAISCDSAKCMFYESGYYEKIE